MWFVHKCENSHFVKKYDNKTKICFKWQKDFITGINKGLRQTSSNNHRYIKCKLFYETYNSSVLQYYRGMNIYSSSGKQSLELKY